MKKKLPEKEKPKEAAFRIRIAMPTTVELDYCPRCGAKHTTLVAIPLKRPSQFNFFTGCPTTGEPIMLALRKEVE